MDGCDLIPNKLLQNLFQANFLAAPIYVMISTSFRQGIIPDQWTYNNKPLATNICNKTVENGKRPEAKRTKRNTPYVLSRYINLRFAAATVDWDHIVISVKKALRRVSKVKLLNRLEPIQSCRSIVNTVAHSLRWCFGAFPIFGTWVIRLIRPMNNRYTPFSPFLLQLRRALSTELFHRSYGDARHWTPRMNITTTVTAALQSSLKTISVALQFVHDDDDDDDANEQSHE